MKKMYKNIILIVLLLSIHLPTQMYSQTSKVTKSTKDNEIEINVEFRDAEMLRSIGILTDTLMLGYYDSPITMGTGDNYNIRTETIVAKANNNSFRFVVKKPESFGYFSIEILNGKANQHYGELITGGLLPVLPGERVYMIVELVKDEKGISTTTRWKRVYKGYGADRLTGYDNIERTVWSRKTPGKSGLLLDSGWIYKNFHEIIDRKIREEEILKSKGLVPENVFKVMELDAQYDRQDRKYGEFYGLYKRTKDKDSLQRLRQIYNSSIREAFDGDTANLVKSRSVAQLIVVQTITDELIGNDENQLNYRNVYRRLKKSYSGELLNKVLAYYLIRYQAVIPNLDSTVVDAARIMGSSPFSKYLERFQKNSATQKAFAFELKNVKGNIVKLTDFNGKIVFTDFWYTGCMPCKWFYQSQLKEVEDYFKNNKNVVFVTISIDKDFSNWRNSALSGDYTSVNAINLYTNGLADRHPIIKFYGITGYPRPLLIDHNGLIVKTNTNRDLRNKDILIKEINALLMQKEQK